MLAPHESPTYQETWAAMTKLPRDKVRAIGVSNFGVPLLEKLLQDPSVEVPAVNQIELHPVWPRQKLVAFCQEKGILLTAYSPIGQPAPGQKSLLLTDETVVEIAGKHGVEPAQVALSWGVQKGWVVVPKSENVERMKKNITVCLFFFCVF